GGAVSGFDTILVIDWSAARRAPPTPRKDAIWIGIARDGSAEDPIYCRGRHEAERWLAECFRTEQDAGRRVLAAFDFPFGYPRGFARRVTGSDDPLKLWDWLEARVSDSPEGENNRFDVASEINRLFDTRGPFWGKPFEDRWPDIPYRKAGIPYDDIAERRAADLAAKASSSCFQLFFNPTVGSQVLTGLPVLARLRRHTQAAVWPFEPWHDAGLVLAEIWPGLIEQAVKAELAQSGAAEIRDRVQVRLLAQALARLESAELARMMEDIPEVAKEEAWILGTGHAELLTERASVGISPPPLRNDCFALPAGVDWTPVDDALALLRKRLSPVTTTETVPLYAALGRVLAEDVV
ncbi:molybdopterin molybdenumtransferase MoeA, partial [Cribrihabitans sp. XS_ASV171]